MSECSTLSLRSYKGAGIAASSGRRMPWQDVAGESPNAPEGAVNVIGKASSLMYNGEEPGGDLSDAHNAKAEGGQLAGSGNPVHAQRE